jgi:4,5-DOPA dioxygenase extradiol
MPILPIELRSSDRQPVWFIGHGSPMNALMDNPFTQSLNQLGASIAPPQAVLVVSAHWLTRGGTFVQASPEPEILYDFGGFPRELHQYQYPAPGSPFFASALADEVKAVQPTTEWGLDHGAWTVLCHLFPKHNIPCFELSINYSRPLGYHISLARELQFLREKGVLILGSGNIVHNIRRMDWNKKDAGYAWAIEFNESIKQAIASRDYQRIINYKQLNGGKESVPSEEHFVPLLYVLALQTSGESAKFFTDLYDLGSFSMTSVLIN